MYKHFVYQSKKQSSNTLYDVIIVGAGASGSALLYTLAQYSSIESIALIEKYERPGQVNSKASNNSQTLHVGDIETNYSLEKVQQVYPAAMMIVHYAQTLSIKERSRFLFPTTKMVLGVGEKEVTTLKKRYEDLKVIFPYLQKLEREELRRIEPAIIEGRKEDIPLIALYTTKGYAVDFECLSEQFVNHAKKIRPDIDLFFSQTVKHLEHIKDGYKITTQTGQILTARALVVDADSYSLLLAQQLGYGKEFSLIPIAGSFYFSQKILHSKVYTVQNPKLPFAAVHGDPDVKSEKKETRWGPTARFYPALEARNIRTMWDFIKSSGLERPQTWLSFIMILLDPIRFFYLLKNMLYELPIIGKIMFIRNVRKIVPKVSIFDMRYARGYGGMRLQRVDTRTRELILGEGKIIGQKAIFNMTPSPGASVSLYNAMRDAETIASFLDNSNLFHKSKMVSELYKSSNTQTTFFEDLSQKDTYVS